MLRAVMLCLSLFGATSALAGPFGATISSAGSVGLNGSLPQEVVVGSVQQGSDLLARVTMLSDMAPRPLAGRTEHHGGVWTFYATFDPGQFSILPTDVSVTLEFVDYDFLGRPAPNEYATLAFQVLTLPAISPTRILRPISRGGAFTSFEVPLQSPTSILATILWGDGKVTTEELDVIEGKVVLSEGLHVYEQPGTYALTLSYLADGQQYGLVTEVTVAAVPAPASATLFGLGLLGLVAGLNRKPAASPLGP